MNNYYTIIYYKKSQGGNRIILNFTRVAVGMAK